MNPFAKTILAAVATIISAAHISSAADLRIVAGATHTPVLLDRADNILFNIRIDAPEGGTFERLDLQLDKESARYVRSVKLYYSGTDAVNVAADKLAATRYILDGAREADPSYSILKAERRAAEHLSLAAPTSLFRGINYFWVSVEMRRDTPLTHKLAATLTTVTVDGRAAAPEMLVATEAPRRMAVGVRHAGDDGSAAFRIPGLVTTARGTLLAVYDVRYNNSKDLQEHIDIGLSRSVDGGRTWQRMRLPLCFGCHDGLPAAQNGAGDPAILYDPVTHRAWVVAAWCHGMGNRMAWHSSKSGMEPAVTGQLVMAYSDDDGKTWSEPINVTRQVKRPEWNFLLQGPGRGIAMKNGTIVFAAQYIDAERMPHACILYSDDHGRSWRLHEGARSNTTEAQVAELPSGDLMLNMRDNRGGSRAVSVTSDMGRTWTEHPSSRKALREPVCMASLISVAADENASGRDILLFSNPDCDNARRDITVKISFDGGATWPEGNKVLLDAGDGWGYSCLTMIDNRTVGILYESSQAHMTFQAIPLTDLLP
ncbi:sialidase [Alistipes sp. Z76]|nr:sialidase [Alistipes sp. Z76]NCE68121.1 sialidase [Muribaculaceae bacterium M3]